MALSTAALGTTGPLCPRSAVASRLKRSTHFTPKRPVVDLIGTSLKGSVAVIRNSNHSRVTRTAAVAQQQVQEETNVKGMTAFLDGLKYNADGLVAVVVQHVDTGEVLMQAFADRAALSETLQTRLATFYSRSRHGRWCKGETSGHFITVQKVFVDCDSDSIIYLGDPIGPACHTGARVCWFSEVELGSEGVVRSGGHTSSQHVPRTTLFELEEVIRDRRRAMTEGTEAKPSWTARLLSKPQLLCKKVREEAGELCETLEKSEGRERAASEMADLLYHAMVLCNVQGVHMEDVLQILRKRFTQSGIEEKALRQGPKKPQE